MRRFGFKRVDRLVAMAVLTAVGLAWTVIVTLDAFRIFIIELNDVGQGAYTLTKAATYVLLTVPRRVYEMFGYAGLIGGLMGLGGLANSGELTALRAAGLSKLRICASVALALAILTIGVATLGETLGPYGEHKAQALSLVAKSRDIALAKGGSLWARDGETVVGVRRARTHNGQVELDGLRVFEFDGSGQLKAFSLASDAVHTQDNWMVHNMRRTVFGAENATSTAIAQTVWRSGLDPHMLALGIINTQYMPLRDLERNIQYLDRNQQDASSYRNAYWARIFYPFNVLVLVFCAVPFAFGTLRSGGLSKRLFIGIIGALSFQLLQSAIVNVGAINGIHPAIANLFPPLILISAAFLYFRRHA
ncbi:MAG: LPS export ABC transporter permease LptG [Rhodanobacter sp.]|nr:LPS export ABC transporter permease LptG [Rhodanobacter sp.]